MSKIFSFKYLTILVLIVAAIAGVGNAAALTLNAAGQNVVEGSSNAYVADAGTVAYTIDADGAVTATATGLTDTFTSARGSLTGAAGTFVACTTGASSITCVFPNTTLNAGTRLSIVATTNS